MPLVAIGALGHSFGFRVSGVLTPLSGHRFANPINPLSNVRLHPHSEFSSMATKKVTRYAVVGAGGRVVNFIDPMVTRFKANNELVALCDTNPGRHRVPQRRLTGELGYHAVHLRGYDAKDFDRMIKETRPDVVLVTTVDAFHHKYIIRAMELGCDAVTEKPMTIDDAKCRQIFRAIQKTGKKLRVTFNYRWAPGTTLVKQILETGVIGEIVHVDMEWRLNTSHGADYFRRWHREKDKSGGLLVHKSTHHFDLVNWWLDAVPDTVFGFGRLAFYGRENAEKRGVKVKYDRYTGQNIKNDPFALSLDDKTGYMLDLYKKTEKHDGYIRDRNVFGDNITAEDTMSLLIKYRTGVVLNYSLNAFVPREGLFVTINGTKGRIEYDEEHGGHEVPGLAPSPRARWSSTPAAAPFTPCSARPTTCPSPWPKAATAAPTRSWPSRSSRLTRPRKSWGATRGTSRARRPSSSASPATTASRAASP